MRRLLLSVAFVLMPVSSTWADTNVEQELKAAYLVHLAKFVTWSQPAADNEVRLCLSSQSEIAQFRDAINERSVGGGRLLKVLMDPEQLIDCDLLFWDAASQRRESDKLSNTHSGLLVVTDFSGGLQLGAVQFFSRDLKLRFAVNEEILDRASYRINSQLLRLARKLN